MSGRRRDFERRGVVAKIPEERGVYVGEVPVGKWEDLESGWQVEGLHEEEGYWLL
jgi:hypothetical protein